MSLYAASGWSVYALIASWAPPSVAVECPAGEVPDFGIGETANFPATFDCVLSPIAATGYGQLRMNTALPFWKAKRASSSWKVSTSSGATCDEYNSSRMNSSAFTAGG